MSLKVNKLVFRVLEKWFIVITKSEDNSFAIYFKGAMDTLNVGRLVVW